MYASRVNSGQSAHMRIRADWPVHSLLDYAISTKISYAGSKSSLMLFKPRARNYNAFL